MKKLVVYYSYTGNTKKIAEMIKNKLDCDILELEPLTPFSTDYDEVVNEYQNNSIDNKEVPIKDINVNLDNYDEIIIGTQVWWYTISPVFATHSSFMQRTYDQISQDLCINNNPATIIVNTASVYGMNDVTHLGLYDIAMMSNIPNLVYLAPTSKEEYFAMLDWSIEQDKYPVAVRVPCNGVISDNRVVDKDYSNLNKYKIEKQGSKIAIIALGDFYQLGEEVVNYIKEKLNIDATLINPRYITGLDRKLLDKISLDYELVITLEDGILEGGFGEKIASYYGPVEIKVKNYGIKKDFYDRYDVGELLKENHLTKEQIIEDIKKIIKD